MSRSFRINARIHEEERLIVFSISGEIDSRALVDKWIEPYSNLSEPWKYNRLLDYRRSEGLVDVRELTRFADWWNMQSNGVEYTLKVAIIVNNALDARRIHVVDQMFPHDIRQSFDSLDDALTWLNEDVTQPATA